MAAVRMATININGITSHTRITLLAEFLRAWEVDILLTQEVTQLVLHTIRGYSTLYNIGTEGRGTAIVARDGIQLENIARLPSGRAMAVTFRDITLINIYAPSGSARRQDRELFYSNELPHVLPMGTPHIVLAGDFNCTQEQGDTTGKINRCRVLTDLVNGLALRDAWQRSLAQPGYTHYSSAGASRIDRIYVTGDLLQRKKGIETIATAFTDHLAVSLHITTAFGKERPGNMENGYRHAS